MDNVLREKVFLALGEASMCWSETPKGVFNDERAKQIGEELLEAIDAYIAMRQVGAEPFMSSLVMRDADGNELGRSPIFIGRRDEPNDG